MDFSKTTYASDAIINALFRGVAVTLPELHVGLVTVQPTESMSGVAELYSGVAGSSPHQGYQRLSLSTYFANGPEDPTSGTGRQITSTQQIPWTPVGDSWNLEGLAGYDDPDRNAGNAWLYYPFPATQSVIDGVQFQIPVGGWTHKED